MFMREDDVLPSSFCVKSLSLLNQHFFSHIVILNKMQICKKNIENNNRSIIDLLFQLYRKSYSILLLLLIHILRYVLNTSRDK